MPRGVKRDRKESMTEELFSLTSAVEKAEKSISEMQIRMEELTKELKFIESEELMNLVKENGLSTEDIKKMIETYNRDTEICGREVAATM